MTTEIEMYNKLTDMYLHKEEVYAYNDGIVYNYDREAICYHSLDLSDFHTERDNRGEFIIFQTMEHLKLL